MRTQLHSLAGLSVFNLMYQATKLRQKPAALMAVGHLLSQIGPQRLAGLLVPLHHFIGLFFIVHRTFLFVCGSSFTA